MTLETKSQTPIGLEGKTCEEISRALSDKYWIRTSRGTDIECEPTPNGIRQYVDVVREVSNRNMATLDNIKDAEKAKAALKELKVEIENVVEAANEIERVELAMAKENSEQDLEKTQEDRETPSQEEQEQIANLSAPNYDSQNDNFDLH